MDSTQYPLVSSIAFGSTNPMDGDLSAIEALYNHVASVATATTPP